MKIRESGMPEESSWASFFDVDGALNSLVGEFSEFDDIVEFGCGYGTFTVPVSKRTKGVVTALDIDPEMITATRERASIARRSNIRAIQRDFIVNGSGLLGGSQSHSMIYNLMHVENPLDLLGEAYRVLVPSGSLSIIHWRCDIPTPRGPELDIRPTPEDCEQWVIESGFADVVRVDLEESCPYHYGMLVKKPASAPASAS